MGAGKIGRIIFFFIFIFVLVFLTNIDDSLPLKNTKTQGQKTKQKEEFSDFQLQKKGLPQVNEEVILTAVGDISYSRGVGRVIKKQNDIIYPFQKVRDYLKKADLVFGNLETPITPGREILDFEMVFRSDPGTGRALKQAGFSILSLANNHTLDFGVKGLEDTINFLESVGIKYVGAGKNKEEAYRPVYIEKKGIKFAFLAYSDSKIVPAHYEASGDRAGTAFIGANHIEKAIKEAKKESDFVIVSMHSGIEYAEGPNENQINFAHAVIDAGADLIIGHHPHVIQLLEKYKGKFIFYSLGNFVFDQPQRQETKEGLTVKIYFTKEGINRISPLPVVMENLAQPSMADKDEAEIILQRLQFPLEKQIAYCWRNNIFEENSRPAVYSGNPGSNGVIAKQENADLNNNSFPEEYNLKNGRLTILEDRKIIWQSPDNWWIDNFIIADLNNDGVLDINLSVWKPGNFGMSRPFWIKENDTAVKNHFFIFDLNNAKVKEVWSSSNLTAPNCEFEIDDVDNDGKNDLIVIEGDYSQKQKCDGNYVAVWKWNGWGFSNEWRSERKKFSGLEIEKIGGKAYILADFFDLQN